MPYIKSSFQKIISKQMIGVLVLLLFMPALSKAQKSVEKLEQELKEAKQLVKLKEKLVAAQEKEASLMQRIAKQQEAIDAGKVTLTQLNSTSLASTKTFHAYQSVVDLSQSETLNTNLALAKKAKLDADAALRQAGRLTRLANRLQQMTQKGKLQTQKVLTLSQQIAVLETHINPSQGKAN